MMQSMQATGLGMFLSRRETVKHHDGKNNSSRNNNKEEEGTISTASVTEASRWSESLRSTSPHDSCNESTASFLTSHHEDEEDESSSHHGDENETCATDAISAFKVGGTGVEKVWFSSVTERFQRFCEHDEDQQSDVEDGADSDDDDHDDESSLVLGTVGPQRQDSTRFPMHESISTDEGLEDVFEVSDEDEDAPENDASQQSEEPQSSEQREEWFHDLTDAFQHYQDQTVALPKKQVTFGMNSCTYHECPYGPLTPQEVEDYWYEEEVLDFFRETTMIAGKALFFNTKGAGAQQDRIRTFSEAYQFCGTMAANATPATSSKNNNSKKSPSKQKLSRQERRVEQYHQKRLQQLYAQDNMVGLEHFVLAAIRGGPKRLRQFILDHSQSRIQREVVGHHSTPLGVGEESWPASMNSSSSENHHKTANILAHVSQCVSQPSSLLAHEMAVAHARAVRE
eukprot:CAMPEP_0172475960 /NCGR_PEP_ID=MMETSP1065-20121228/70136_1 /TAXON_ID=265537 /ORGANISM="Amphiprora paludosa, Strain CCMP125" /LENGTH=454 /DNA_ID=CAMNT_0013234175 /DNA_START=128 /DNA_END=1492 /DNA_ORIENTATION=+